MTRDDIETAYLWSPHPKGRARQRQRVSRLEDYLFIGGDRMSAAQAAERLGVNPRTIVRYRALLRAIRPGGTAS